MIRFRVSTAMIAMFAVYATAFIFAGAAPAADRIVVRDAQGRFQGIVHVARSGTSFVTDKAGRVVSRVITTGASLCRGGRCR